MRTTRNQAQLVHKADGRRLHLAFDLGNSRWHLAFSDGTRERFVTITARDVVALAEQIERAKRGFGLRGGCDILSCYEAGRDGFWLHRHLEAMGVRNLVIDPASIETSRRGRRAKTDRLDSKMLVRKLIQFEGGDRDVWVPLHVPTPEQEHERRLMRHRKQIQKEIFAHQARIRGLLALHGLTVARLTEASLLELTSRLGELERQEILFQHQRLALARDHLRHLDAEVAKRLQTSDSEESKQSKEPDNGHAAPSQPQAAQGYRAELTERARQLTGLKAIGATCAWRLASEFFWRDFQNRRQVGAAAGLTATPHNSGHDVREQGISKAGSGAVRDMMVEVSWLWLRWQPDSALSKWYQERWAAGGTRLRKIGIVALARKLLIALWRYLQFGVVPDGALLRAEAKS